MEEIVKFFVGGLERLLYPFLFLMEGFLQCIILDIVSFRAYNIETPHSFHAMITIRTIRITVVSHIYTVLQQTRIPAILPIPIEHRPNRQMITRILTLQTRQSTRQHPPPLILPHPFHLLLVVKVPFPQSRLVDKISHQRLPLQRHAREPKLIQAWHRSFRQLATEREMLRGIIPSQPNGIRACHTIPPSKGMRTHVGQLILGQCPSPFHDWLDYLGAFGSFEQGGW
mmetsp:Transcript_2087/g.4617  ORF Transcript_2087/g.4617 Transcript_2087/m.4617 type:complete len:227 (-) Transcript_2087:841-1521(-)